MSVKELAQKRPVLIIGLFTITLCIGLVVFLLLQTPSKKENKQTTPPKSSNVDTAPPHITLQDITDASHLQGTITVGVEVTDDHDIQRVEYYIDGALEGVTYAHPFNLQLDTTKFSNGSHQIWAKAFDSSGNVAQSTQITITIANDNPTADATQPTQSASNNAVARTTLYVYSAITNLLTSGGSSGNTTDTSAPSAPTNLSLSADDGYTSRLQWSASSDNVGVAQYIIYRDGVELATTTSTNYSDQTVAPGNLYSYKVVAKDAANNISANSNQPNITMAATTIWHSAESPAAGNFDNASTPIELGVKFRPLVDGKITGVRFYKASGSAGPHVGNLWSSGGSPLATATFSNETASGWQEVSFSSPVSVTAGTTYVASYFAPSGGYGYTSAYFSSAGLTGQYLNALQTGVDGNNGLFRTGSTGFPSSSFNNTHYWVDVAFAPGKTAGGPTAKAQDNSGIFPGFPGSNNTGVVVGKRLPKRDRKMFIYNDNAVLDNIEVNADINVQANNVTIRNVRVTSPQSLIWGITQITGKSGLTVEDTEIYGDGVHQLQYGIQDNGTNFTGRRLHIHTMTQAVQSNINVLLEDSYFHGQIYFAGDHSGAYLSTGGDNIVLTHNNMRNPLNQTTTLGLFCDFGPVTNVTATNNLLSGGGYPVYAPPCAGSGNIKFINNKFDRAIWPNGGFFGPVTSYNPAQPGNQWTGNTWLEDGTTVNP